MQGIDFEFEELLIAEAVGLALHRLDLVVRALQRPRRYPAIVVGQDALAVPGQRCGELLEQADARRLRAADPSA